MSRLLLGLFSLALMDSPRRIEYPAENFSISIPDTWHEIEPSTLAVMSAAVPRVPGLPEIKIRHGYTAQAAPPLFAWVAIIVTDAPADEAMFEKLDWTKQRFEDAIAQWQASGGTLQQGQLNSMWYDKTRRLLWSTTQSTHAGVGDLRTLSGAHLTTTGTIQVHCYSKAEDFARDQPVCREFIESVSLDPKVVIPPRLESGDYKTLVEQLEAGNTNVNFRSLRLACMKSPDCEPRATRADLAEFNAASRDNQYAKAAELGQRLIRRGFVNLEIHAALVIIYRALKDQAKAAFHMKVTDGLLRSILFSGDGNSPATAWEIISDREELSVLAARGIASGGEVSKSRIDEGGHHYERWEIWDPVNEKKVIVFFNTDAFTAKSRVGEN